MAFNNSLQAKFRTMSGTGSKAPMQGVKLSTNQSNYRTPGATTSTETQNPNRQLDPESLAKQAQIIGKTAKLVKSDVGSLIDKYRNTPGESPYFTESGQMSNVNANGFGSNSVGIGKDIYSPDYWGEGGRGASSNIAGANGLGNEVPEGYDMFSGKPMIGDDLKLSDTKSLTDKIRLGEQAVPGEANSVIGGTTGVTSGVADSVDVAEGMTQADQISQAADAAKSSIEGIGQGTGAASGATPVGSIIGTGASLANGDYADAGVHAAAAAMNYVPVYGQAASAATELGYNLGKSFGLW